MSQALHIFRKDLRYLRVEIAIFLALAALFAIGSSSQIAQALATGQDNVAAIAVDDSAVYWLVNGNGTPGGVMELPLSAVAW